MAMTPITEYRSHLCLGGPLDGRRHDAGEVSTFRVPVLPAMSTLSPRGPISVAGAQTVLYVLTWFNTPEGRVSFWTPRDMTPLEALQRLVNGYRAVLPPDEVIRVGHWPADDPMEDPAVLAVISEQVDQFDALPPATHGAALLSLVATVLMRVAGDPQAAAAGFGTRLNRCVADAVAVGP